MVAVPASPPSRMAAIRAAAAGKVCLFARAIMRGRWRWSTCAISWANTAASSASDSLLSISPVWTVMKKPPGTANALSDESSTSENENS